MALQNDGKLKGVLNNWAPQTVGTSAWLSRLGVSRQLAKHYVAHGWLDVIGNGAFKRPQEVVGWQGAVYTLQNQLGMPVHVGALSALSAQGLSHYLRLSHETVYLFSGPSIKMPTWFQGYDWQVAVETVRSNFLPDAAGLTAGTYGSMELSISAPERAILECLYLTPSKLDLVECYEVMQGLMNLRPKLMQTLLESCKSVKTKRLFLYMASKAKLPVMRHLDVSRIDLGSGPRSLAKSGLYDAEYQLTLPEELVKHD